MFLFSNKKINMSMIHNAKAHIPVSYMKNVKKSLPIKKTKPIKNKSIVTIKSNTDAIIDNGNILYKPLN